MELKNLRKSAGITQKVMAEKIGISLNHYQKIEKGTSPIKKTNFETVIKIAKNLNITLDIMEKIN